MICKNQHAFFFSSVLHSLTLKKLQFLSLYFLFVKLEMKWHKIQFEFELERKAEETATWML